MTNGLSILLAFMLAGCSSITQIGTVGPRNLPVYSIRDTGFLSENRTILVLDDGKVVGITGATVSGPGPLIVNLAGTAIMAGAVAYSASTLAEGLKAAQLRHSGHVEVTGKCDGCIRITP